MLNSINIKANMYKEEEHKSKRYWYRIMVILAMIIAFITIYVLIIPAITMEETLICEIPEHIHNEKCYDTNNNLICQKEEHIHTYECYDAPKNTEKVYYCGKTEHTHTDECYFSDGKLKCTIPEHTHFDYCHSGTFLVDYYFGEKEYHQDGLTTIFISDLFRNLDIKEKVSNISEVIFTNNELIKIEKVELENGSYDWTLKSLMAFNTDELITITFTNGKKLDIITKDAAFVSFNLHNAISGKNNNERFKLHLDYYDKYSNHIDTYEYFSNGKFESNSYDSMTISAQIGKPCTITVSPAEESEGVDFKAYLQLGSEPQIQTDTFYEDAMTYDYSGTNVCFYEVVNLGKLKITKKAVNAIDPNKTYHFVVFHHAINYRLVVTEFDIKDEESYTIDYYYDNVYYNNNNLYITETNAGSNCTVSYMVNETTSYTPAQISMEGRIPQDCGTSYKNEKFIKIPISDSYDTFNVVCTNEYQTAKLNINKKILSINPSQEGPFEFEIAVTDSSNQPIDITGITGQPSGVTIKASTNNVLCVTLSGFTASTIEKTISDIKVPAGSKVTITETYSNSLDYKVNSSGGDINNGKTVTINSASNKTVTYSNEAPVVYQYIAVTDNGETKTISNAGGTLTNSQEKLYCSTDSASGSSPSATQGYEFLGWFTDATCTQSVYVTDTNGKIVPAKNETDSFYHGGIYYALFEKEPEINGAILPETGGIGSKIFYEIGYLLLAFGIIGISCIILYKQYNKNN